MRFIDRPTFLESQIFLERPQFLQELGQRVVHIIGNVCFGSFVLSVLVFTVIAITYKPPDSFLQQAKSYDNLFTSVGNSTFQPDDSVLITGDDLDISSVGVPPAINSTFVDAEVHPGTGGCNIAKAWNCSDSGVRIAIEKMNLFHFPELDIYQYRKVVQGSSEGECDVAWKYRPKNMTTPRMYRDYRRYHLIRNDDCSFKVKSIGKWHSGVNARPKRQRPEDEERSGVEGSVQPLEEGVDVISDLVDVAPKEPDNRFQRTKYLYYTRGADYCKSMNQYMWSFLCALGEARYLNRTFVMDLDLCLSAENNPGHQDEPGKDFRYYFDYEHLENVTSIIEKERFEVERQEWNSQYPSESLREKHVLDHGTKPADLKSEKRSVLYRDFISESEDDNYWYRVCEGEAEKYIQRPWNFVWKSKRLMNIVNAICNKLDWDFDVAHIIRGYKAANKELWPNLDRDTSPENLIAKLKGKIGNRRKLYIATNEPDPRYFDRLREPFEVHMLDDFSYLWAENSEWYNETQRVHGNPVEFDGYMRVIVDTEMLYRGKKRVETFNDITKDCKQGVNKC